MSKQISKILAETALTQMSRVDERDFDLSLKRIQACEEVGQTQRIFELVQSMHEVGQLYKAAELLIAVPLAGHKNQMELVRAMYRARMRDMAQQLIATRNS